jgi:hypothetical protein
MFAYSGAVGQSGFTGITGAGYNPVDAGLVEVSGFIGVTHYSSMPSATR